MIISFEKGKMKVTTSKERQEQKKIIKTPTLTENKKSHKK